MNYLQTCVLENNNSCGKWASSFELPITFDGRFKVTSAPFSIPDFNLLSCELDNCMFTVLYWVVLSWYYIKIKIKILSHSLWKLLNGFFRFFNDEKHRFICM